MFYFYGIYIWLLLCAYPNRNQIKLKVKTPLSPLRSADASFSVGVNLSMSQHITSQCLILERPVKTTKREYQTFFCLLESLVGTVEGETFYNWTGAPMSRSEIGRSGSGSIPFWGWWLLTGAQLLPLSGPRKRHALWGWRRSCRTASCGDGPHPPVRPTPVWPESKELGEHIMHDRSCRTLIGP